MYFKGIIFDLDNTIYDYDECHSYSLNITFKYLLSIYNKKLDESILKDEYVKISNDLKNELGNTASSHNKGIYFKKLIENLNLDYKHFTIINKMYWDNFFEKIKPFMGFLDFIKFIKNLNIKIGIITNYETEHQIYKIEKLNILEYIDSIITSEEIGIEKPSIKIFCEMLNKLSLKNSEVIMIGDNFKTDILGAINSNIYAFWLNQKDEMNEKYQTFSDYTKLHKHFKKQYYELNILKKISRYCGERFDLAQAGGGNTSVKLNDLMFIKSSGINLSNINESDGYSIISNKRLSNDIKNKKYNPLINYNLFNKNKASMETYMHSILKKYTVHLHPIQVNKLLVSKDANKIMKKLFPNSLILDYATPGIDLCKNINAKYKNQKIIFLLNHGIIITENKILTVYKILDSLIEKVEQYQKINFSKYKFTNLISKFFSEDYIYVSYLCQDSIINNYLNNKKDSIESSITFPDLLIYCGYKILFMNNFEDILNYRKEFGAYPKIMIKDENIYITDKSLKKCKEIEDVLKANLIILDSNFDKNYLDLNELNKLNNLDSEKFRQSLY